VDGNNLHGWKQIAGYLRCSVRTVQRYEKLGLPITRRDGKGTELVFASPEQIHAWLLNQEAPQLMETDRSDQAPEATNLNHDQGFN
jgi:phage terminase Nu1 subunit (DNA packaging protein)